MISFWISISTNKELDQDRGQLFEVRMKAREEKGDSLQKIRFDVAAKFNDNGPKTKEKTLLLKLNELVLGASTTLIQ